MSERDSAQSAVLTRDSANNSTKSTTKQHGKTDASALQLVHGVAEKEGVVEAPTDISIAVTTALELPALSWRNYNNPPARLIVTNTGHTVNVGGKWEGNRSYLRDGPLRGQYVFAQMHFHWGPADDTGSEHSVDGSKMPMELHVVHINRVYRTQELALKENDGVAILIYLFQLQEQDNSDLTPIVEALPMITLPQTSTTIEPMALEKMILPFQKDYFMYWGAVTSPTCKHRILWLTSRTTLGISSEQLRQFRQIRDVSGQYMVKNFRETHPRTSYTLFHVNPSSKLESTLLAPFPGHALAGSKRPSAATAEGEGEGEGSRRSSGEAASDTRRPSAAAGAAPGAAPGTGSKRPPGVQGPGSSPLDQAGSQRPSGEGHAGAGAGAGAGAQEGSISMGAVGSVGGSEGGPRPSAGTPPKGDNVFDNVVADDGYKSLEGTVLHEGSHTDALGLEHIGSEVLLGQEYIPEGEDTLIGGELDATVEEEQHKVVLTQDEMGEITVECHSSHSASVCMDDQPELQFGSPGTQGQGSAPGSRPVTGSASAAGQDAAAEDGVASPTSPKRRPSAWGKEAGANAEGEAGGQAGAGAQPGAQPGATHAQGVTADPGVAPGAVPESGAAPGEEATDAQAGGAHSRSSSPGSTIPRGHQPGGTVPGGIGVVQVDSKGAVVSGGEQGGALDQGAFAEAAGTGGYLDQEVYGMETAVGGNIDQGGYGGETGVGGALDQEAYGSAMAVGGSVGQGVHGSTKGLEGSIVQGTPGSGTASGGAPGQAAQGGGASVGGAPGQGGQVGGAQGGGAAVGGVPGQGGQAGGTTVGGVPSQVVPGSATALGGAPGQGVPGSGTAHGGVPAQGVPGSVTALEGAPGQAAQGGGTGVGGVPGQGVPGSATALGGAPGQGVPGSATFLGVAPGQGVPGSATALGGAPGQAAQGGGTGIGGAPGQAAEGGGTDVGGAPGQAAQGGGTGIGGAPGQGVPGSATALGGAPGQAAQGGGTAVGGAPGQGAQGGGTGVGGTQDGTFGAGGIVDGAEGVQELGGGGGQAGEYVGGGGGGGGGQDGGYDGAQGGEYGGGQGGEGGGYGGGQGGEYGGGGGAGGQDPDEGDQEWADAVGEPGTEEEKPEDEEEEGGGQPGPPTGAGAGAGGSTGGGAGGSAAGGPGGSIGGGTGGSLGGAAGGSTGMGPGGSTAMGLGGSTGMGAAGGSTGMGAAGGSTGMGAAGGSTGMGVAGGSTGMGAGGSTGFGAGGSTGGAGGLTGGSRPGSVTGGLSLSKRSSTKSTTNLAGETWADAEGPPTIQGEEGDDQVVAAQLAQEGAGGETAVGADGSPAPGWVGAGGQGGPPEGEGVPGAEGAPYGEAGEGEGYPGVEMPRPPTPPYTFRYFKPYEQEERPRGPEPVFVNSLAVTPAVLHSKDSLTDLKNPPPCHGQAFEIYNAEKKLWEDMEYNRQLAENEALRYMDLEPHEWDQVAAEAAQMKREARPPDAEITGEGWPFDPFQSQEQLLSPIDVPLQNLAEIKLPPLVFDGHFRDETMTRLANTGETVEARVLNPIFTPTLHGGPLRDDYIFDSMHFHWSDGASPDCLGSVHKFGGKRYCMEVHLLHYKAEYGSKAEALKHQGGLCAVAFMLHLTSIENPFFSRLARELVKIEAPMSCTPLDHNALLCCAEAAAPYGYVTYPGTLIGREQNLNVVWIVFPRPVGVCCQSTQQFHKLRPATVSTPAGGVLRTHDVLDRPVLKAVPP